MSAVTAPAASDTKARQYDGRGRYIIGSQCSPELREPDLLVTEPCGAPFELRPCMTRLFLFGR